jgi:Xaa-Pro aminopeptidase
MILSNEPGYYKPGSHGIRIENLVEVIERKLVNGTAVLGFSNLTLVPYDRALMDAEQLTVAEINWVNAYHATVFAALSPMVEAHVRTWLATACAPI